MLFLIIFLIAAVMLLAYAYLDPRTVRVSRMIWIPFAWLFIASSRPMSEWLSPGAPGGYESDAYLDGSPLDRNLLTLLIAAAVWVLVRRWTKVKAILRANPYLLIFFGYCAASMFWADYPFVVFKRWVRSVGDIAMVLIILTESNPVQAFNKLMTRLSAILIPLSIVFIRFFPSLGRSYTRGGSPMWTGVGTDKNALGMICMIFGISLLWRGLNVYADGQDPLRKRRLIGIGGLFAMILYLLLVVNSQTAFACFVLASTLLALTAVNSVFRKQAFLHLTMGAMIGLTFSTLFLGLGSSALSGLGRDSSLTGRTEVWETVLPFAVNPLIGAGYENFWIGTRLHEITAILGGLNQAHNGYIETYLNIGWVGLILLGMVVAVTYRNTVRGLRTEPDVSRLKLAFVLICLVYNFTEASFKMMSPVWIMFLWAALKTPTRCSERVRQAAGRAKARFLAQRVSLPSIKQRLSKVHAL